MSVRVSVVLPAPADADLTGALQSVLAQDERDLEVLVVGPAKPAWPDDARVRWIRAGASPAAALNAGMREARGDWIAFQDAGGEWLPFKLSAQLAIARADPGAEWIGGATLLSVGDRAWCLPRAGAPIGEAAGEDLTRVAWALSAWLVRASTLRQVGALDETAPDWADWDLLLRLAGHCRYRALDALVSVVRRPVSAPARAPEGVARLWATHARVLERFPAWRDAWAFELAQAGHAPPGTHRLVPRALGYGRRRTRSRPWDPQAGAPVPARTLDGPRVSVVMPTHNRARQLPHAIASVLAQTYANLELIVVDDASTDETPDVVRRFADPRLRYVRLPENRRGAAARNAGVREARGDFVSFHDDDDWWLCRKLEVQVAALQAAPARVGLHLTSHIQLTPRGAEYVGGSRDFAALDFGGGMTWRFGMIATPGWLARRAALEQAGPFDESIRAWHDWEMALRLRDACEFAYTPEPLFIQDQRRAAGTGTWDNRPLHTQSLAVIMRKHGARWQRRPDVLARHALILGVSELARGDGAGGRRRFREALRIHPRQLRAPAYWLLSFLGPGAIDGVEQSTRRAWHRIRRWLRKR